MVLQLPIPNSKQTDVASSSSASNSPALNSLHSINRDVAATPIISNLASGVYPIGGGVDQQRTYSLQKMQQQQSSFATTQRIQQGPIMTQQTQMMHTNPSLYNNISATQMMPASMQPVVPTSNNSGMNNNMYPWMRMGGQSNLLGQVTLGGRSLLNPSLMTTGDSSFNNNRGISLLGGRGRMEGPPPSPSIPSESGVFQAGQNTLLTNRLQSAPSKVVNFEELPVSTLEDGKDSSETANDEQVAFTTELLTLSVHEALTFEGVELALHPDLFHQRKDKEGSAIGIQPGDLVEIRVWSPRPGITTTPKSATKSKPKVIAGAKPSLHSRNTSLASSINSSLLATASSPSVHNANISPNTAIPDQTQVPSDIVGKNSNLESPGLLVGEQFLETPPTQGNHASTPSTSSLLAGAASSLFRNTNPPADSHTPSSVLVPGVPSVPSLVPSQKTSVSSESTIASHSRDNSFTTMSTLAGVHSRDSSLLVGMHSRDSSLLQTSSNLSNNSSPTKDSPLTSPQANSAGASLATEAVNEGLPQTLITNLSLHSLTESNDGSQTLPARRDGPSLLATTAMSSPLQQQRSETKVTQTSSSTPLSTTPTKSPLSKSPSNKSPSQRPPVALPPLPREQARDPNDIKQGNSTARHFSDSHTTIHVRSDSISSTIPVSTGSLAGTGSHRRHSSTIPGSSQPQPGPLLPPSHRNNLRSVLNRNISDDDIATDVLESLQETHFVRISFVMPVSDQSLKSIKSSARTKVSLLRRVADLYQITSFDTVTVTQIPKHTRPFVQQRISADFVTITFKDQFVSRGDMFYFQRSFLNSWVYEGKRLSFNGIRTNTKVIRHGDHIVRSGIISEETKLTFRSRSARIIWLVQMSSEMWDFASPYMAHVGNQKNREPTCETYFNKFITFARKLFEKWKQLELTHNLTVVFFSRTFIRKKEDLPLSNTPSVIHTDSDGRMYCDHYRIVLNNETRTTDWESLVHRMKQAFVSYPKEVKWDLTPGKERIPSTAGQGNILEAVNMTLNLLHLHFIDRDLHRTGNSIVIMTAGNGVFEVSKNLAGITKQRMMDNGIGSDMLSLGLPPLHVIPFFLFRNDNKENTAEEAQGFDDDGGAGSSFEVPHWMNLSYVDYDDDEEAMLYKEHINDDADDAKDEQGENDTNTNPSVSNGFLRRSKPACRDNVSTPLSDEVATAKDHARHLISQRNFEDILQACRPRNRGEYGSGLPASLTTLLKKFPPDVMQPSLSGQVVALDQAGRLTPQRSSARAKNFEWGAVNFDEFNMNKLSSSVQRAQFLRMSTSGSDSSSASSFTSIGSHIHQSMSGTYLQSTVSLGGQSNVVGDDSSTTLDIDSENPQGDNADPILMMKKMMREHDKQAFSGRSGRVSPTNSFTNSFNSGTAGSPKLDGSPLERSQSMFPLLSKNSGGIEAALAHYDGSTPDSTDVKPIATVPVSADKRLLSTSPIVSTMPFTFSLDRRNEGYNSNFARLGPERITALTEGLQPFDFQRKSLSKGLGERRSSFAYVTKQQVPESPIKTPIRNKSKKHSYHQHRYRRKVWVLNPFRQEDEDEVLAKRTHNRRRWSHVFPLGEAEFKKHAGPNWKSLCQPAILPMTIDFHPDPAELQDQAKFRIKQYSVTLPPFGETNYKDATELLDDLLVQRMRQDFQLVPRSILSAQRETENTTNHTLSRTLSMGHKIQKLSYNPSSDSVDVVQYYANFAENESPQSYRYLLWSALRQDYVSVVQTFTKYTSPYKWNELDMLLSDDSIKSISDEMRHPRISFVILPDPFADQIGESEYASKFNKLVDYFNKLQSKGSSTIDIEMIMKSDAAPKGSKVKRSFIVDLRKRSSDKYEWCEIVLDSNCDTRRTFRITIQWLVAIGSKIDQQAQLLSRRCAQYGLNLIHIPSFSSMRNSFLNPFAVPITFPLRSKSSVDSLEKALTNDFDFVYDGSHLADPNELIDCLDGFDFTVNRWSMNKRKKFVPAKQYLHRTGTLFMRLVRDSQGKAIVISYLNNRHIAGDQQLLDCARAIFIEIEQFITAECEKAGC